MIFNVVDLQGFLHYRRSTTLFAPCGFYRNFHFNINFNIKNTAFQPLTLIRIPISSGVWHPCSSNTPPLTNNKDCIPGNIRISISPCPKEPPLRQVASIPFPRYRTGLWEKLPDHLTERTSEKKPATNIRAQEPKALPDARVPPSPSEQRPHP